MVTLSNRQHQFIKKYQQRVFIALDFSQQQQLEQHLACLESDKVGIKIGLEAFLQWGPSRISQLVADGWQIFLDLKLHDIPRTMLAAVRQVATLGVKLTTVHATAGYNALQQCQQWLVKNHYPLQLVGVTVLTSFDQKQFDQLGVAQPIAAWSLHLAGLCVAAKLPGCVCSFKELSAIKQAYPDLQCVVPGIRIDSSIRDDDQQRTTSPESAMQAGADYLVLGRSFWQLASD